jgi:hypothetical protein
MTSRSITGLIAAALLALPAAAQAETQTHGTGIWMGGLAGAEWGDSSGYQLRLDGEVPITRLAPNFQVSGALTLSYSGLAHDLSVVELVPAARFTWLATPQVGGYGDVGLGYVHASANGNGVSGSTMRFGVGSYYQMSQTVRFVLELAFHPHWGDYNQTTTTLLLGAKFRI